MSTSETPDFSSPLEQWSVELVAVVLLPVGQEEDGGRGVQTQGLLRGQQELAFQQVEVFLRPHMVVTRQVVDVAQQGLGQQLFFVFPVFIPQHNINIIITTVLEIVFFFKKNSISLLKI